MRHPRSILWRPVLAAAVAAAAVLGTLPRTTSAANPAATVLMIGATGTLTGNIDSPQEKSGKELLQGFIRDEIGMKNEIVHQADWRDQAQKLVAGELHLGMFQGYEFAWAQELHPELKPLAVAVAGARYPVAAVYVRRTNAAADFGGLAGQSLYLPTTNQGCLRLFVDRQCEAAGKPVGSFFSRVASPENVEDGLDDVVDGKADAIVVDRAAFEAYQKDKPGRAKQLKLAAASAPFPPMVVAYVGTTLDDATVRNFRAALLAANRKKKGETLLTLARLTGFDRAPDDFDRVLAATRKAYPPVTTVGAR